MAVTHDRPCTVEANFIDCPTDRRVITVVVCTVLQRDVQFSG